MRCWESKSELGTAPSSKEVTLSEMSSDHKQQQDKMGSGRCHKREGGIQNDHFYLGKSGRAARRKRHRAGPLRALEVGCWKEETHSRRREQGQEKPRGRGSRGGFREQQEKDGF